jgi:hypothetical protein
MDRDEQREQGDSFKREIIIVLVGISIFFLSGAS